MKPKAQKKETIVINKNRDAQFKNIARIYAEYRESSNAIISFYAIKKKF